MHDDVLERACEKAKIDLKKTEGNLVRRVVCDSWRKRRNCIRSGT